MSRACATASPAGSEPPSAPRRPTMTTPERAPVHVIAAALIGLACVACAASTEGDDPSATCDDDQRYALTFCMGLAFAGTPSCDDVCSLPTGADTGGSGTRDCMTNATSEDCTWRDSQGRETRTVACFDSCGNRVWLLDAGDCAQCRLCARDPGFAASVGHAWERACQSCTTNDDCQSDGEWCHEGACVACVTDADCAASGGSSPTACRGAACVSVMCLQNSDCDSFAPFCLDDTCVGCRDDGDCPAPLRCQARECVNPTPEDTLCATDADCPQGYACDGDRCAERGPCVAPCDGRECGDDGCGGDCGTCPDAQDRCVEGRCDCQPECDGLACGDDGCGGDCGPCDPDEDCVEQQCVPGGGLCSTPADCPEMETTCDPESHRCVPGCLDDDECPASFGCDRPGHGLQVGTCVAACQTNADCPLDQVCWVETMACDTPGLPHCDPCRPNVEDDCGPVAACVSLQSAVGTPIGDYCLIPCSPPNTPEGRCPNGSHCVNLTLSDGETKELCFRNCAAPTVD